MRDPIDVLALNISRSIKHANPEEATTSIEVMSYALSLILNMLLTTLFILIIGQATHTLTETVLSLFAFAVLRMTAKGAHVKSMTLCVIVTTIFVAILPHIPVSNSFMLPLTCICLICVYVRSTVSLRMKVISMVIILVFFLIHSPYLILGCLGQAITLLPKGR